VKPPRTANHNHQCKHFPVVEQRLLYSSHQSNCPCVIHIKPDRLQGLQQTRGWDKILHESLLFWAKAEEALFLPGCLSWFVPKR